MATLLRPRGEIVTRKERFVRENDANCTRTRGAIVTTSVRYCLLFGRRCGIKIVAIIQSACKNGHGSHVLITFASIDRSHLAKYIRNVNANKASFKKFWETRWIQRGVSWNFNEFSRIGVTPPDLEANSFKLDFLEKRNRQRDFLIPDFPLVFYRIFSIGSFSSQSYLSNYLRTTQYINFIRKQRHVCIYFS